MSDVAITFDHVAKSFRHFASPLQRLRDVILPFGKHDRISVPVLTDVSFTVSRGEALAIIGANGVGKSTILHLVAGLIEPSSGSVTINGRVTALLDLGGSFLPDLTGRENARFFDRIITRGEGDTQARERIVEEFAGIGEFFDRPVRTYSSGMFLRLAFACAVAEQPDILLIDEVLAVGDARFQQKCYRRLAELRERGTTIVLVTHVMHALTNICDRVLVLDRGNLAYDGEPGSGIDRYYQLFLMQADQSPPRAVAGEFRYGFGGAAVTDIVALRDGGESANAFNAGETVRVIFEVDFTRAVDQPQFGFACSTKEGAKLYMTTSDMLGATTTPAVAGEHRRIEVIFRLDVGVGDLFVDVSVFEVVHGTVSVLDARIHVLHLTIATPRHYVGITDFSAVIRDMR